MTKTFLSAAVSIGTFCSFLTLAVETLYYLDYIKCFAHFITESQGFTIIFSLHSLANHAEIHVLISLLIAYDNVLFFVFVPAPVFVFVESQHVPSGTSS